MKVREAVRHIMGQESADKAMQDFTPEWVVFMATCEIEARGGPRDDIERRFLAHYDAMSNAQANRLA